MASIDEFDDAGYGVRSTGSTMQRRRLRLYECWYTVPRRVQRLNGGEWHGQTFEEGNADQRIAILAGQSSLATVTAMEMRVAVMTARDLLYDGPTPYRHNRYPFTPVWGYRRKRDGMPYGVIRHMRDIQVDMNKRASKALFILSSNKVIVEENNVDDWQEFEEAVSLAQRHHQGAQRRRDQDRRRPRPGRWASGADGPQCADDPERQRGHGRTDG